MLQWQKLDGDVHRSPGFVIEPTGNPHEPYALFRTDAHTERATQYATMSGSLEDCQKTAEVLATGGEQAPSDNSGEGS